MKHTQMVLAACAALAALGFVAPATHAQTLLETSSGQTLGTAQDASAVTFTQINGSIAPASDADLYRIYISSPGTFSATTVNATTSAGGSGVDTALFLFDATGHGIATNDDASGASFDSTLPAGSALYKNLSPGYFYIGISSSGNEPINSNSQLIFNGYPGGDTTAVRGPTSGLNPTTLSTFDSSEYDTTTTGAYEIDFTGVSAAPAPEPSALAALAVGILGVGTLALRARKRHVSS